MKRKILSLILVFAMTVSLLTVGTGAVEPTYGDTAGHWAESSIERWSGHGIIQGSNGQFDPNGQLTCAQLATILAKLLKLPAAKDAGFTDNTADAWYYDAINRCAAAGILNGNGDGTVTPEAPITRERAMVMLARALGIEPIRKPDLTKYTDAAQVSAYAQGYVAALIEAGIVGGVTADELAPQDNINRASTVTILDRAISTYADKAGATVKADGKGIVLVVAENVKITGAPEGTKIVVADGATGLTVNGKSVSDDQTYIVPKTTTSSGSSSSGGHSHTHSYNETTHKCSCGEVDPAYAVASVSGKNYLTLSEAITAAQSGNKPVTLAASKTTTETIQEILDGQHGSIDDLTIELPTGMYDNLELGRATKYEGSNTEYMVGGFDNSAPNYQKFTSSDDIRDYKKQSEWTANCFYSRTLNNVTIKAADSATVNIKKLSADAGQIYGTPSAPKYDYVLDTEVPDTNKSYYIAFSWKNVTFEGINFESSVNIESSSSKTIIDGLHFEKCNFNSGYTALVAANDTNAKSNGMGIRLVSWTVGTKGNLKNLTVNRCNFEDCYEGVYTNPVYGVSVKENTFKNINHNAVAIQDVATAVNHGAVIIDHNTFANIGDRIIRFNNVGADTSITITYNTATNSGDESDEVIKITSLAQGATCDIHDNSWGDGKKVNIPDSRVEMQAQIGEAQYATLAAALAAAKDGDTVKLVGNISTDEGIGVAKKITLDMAGRTITSSVKQVFTVTGSGDLTITGNGTISGPAGEAAKALDGKAVLMVSGESAKLTVLNGTITAGGVGDCGMYGIYVADGGNVILGDADTKTGPTITTWFAAVGENNTTSPANITIYGGEYTAQAAPAESDSWAYFCAPVYASASGNITISGGTFNGYYGISSRYVKVAQNLNISGGIFNGTKAALFVDNVEGSAKNGERTIAITGGTFSSDPSAYLAVGYKATENSSIWTVKKMDGYAMIEGLDGWYETLTDAAKAWRESKGIATTGGNMGGHPEELTEVEAIKWTIVGTVTTGDGNGVVGTSGSLLSGGYIYPSITIKSVSVNGTNNAKLKNEIASDFAFSAGAKNVEYNGITFPEYVSFNSYAENVSFQNCTFNGGLKVMQAINVTVDTCVFDGDGSKDFAFMAQAVTNVMKKVDFKNNTVSGFMRGLNIQANLGQTAEAVVTITGNNISGLTGKTENEFTYGSAIQLTSAKTFSVTGNTIGTSEVSIPVNAFHIYQGCTAESIVITGNTVYAKYLCWNAAANDGNTYDMSKVTFNNNTCAIEVPNKCCTKTEVIDSAFTLPQ